jgi:hypothetical protein
MDPRLSRFQLRGPADPGLLAEAEEGFGVDLPPGYKGFMLTHDGGEGWVGDHYLALWSVAELLAFNRDYDFGESAPSLIGFGGNGGGEAFAFDKRAELRSVVTVPLIGLSDHDAIPVAVSLDDLLDRMRTTNSLF